jgi:hypothetical protein
VQNQVIGIVGALFIGFVLGIGTLNVFNEDGGTDSLPQTTDNDQGLIDASGAMKEAAQALAKLSAKIGKTVPHLDRNSNHLKSPAAPVYLLPDQEERILAKLRQEIESTNLTAIRGTRDLRNEIREPIGRDQVVSNWESADIATKQLMFLTELEILAKLGQPYSIGKLQSGETQWKYRWGIVRFVEGRLSLIAYND